VAAAQSATPKDLIPIQVARLPGGVLCNKRHLNFVTMSKRPKLTPPARLITADEVETFARDGVVLLKAIYPPEWLDYLRYLMKGVFDRDGSALLNKQAVGEGKSVSGARLEMTAELAKKLQSQGREVAFERSSAPLTGRNIIETDTTSWNEETRWHHCNSPLAEIVSVLTSSAQVNYYSDQMFLKDSFSPG
jgi:hypothetical protein